MRLPAGCVSCWCQTRVKRKPSVPKTPPKEVWINQPNQTENGSLESTDENHVESSPPGETEVVMLESTPPRDSPVRTHQDGEQGCGSLPSAPTIEEDDQINRMIDSVMPKKTPARRADKDGISVWNRHQSLSVSVLFSLTHSAPLQH